MSLLVLGADEVYELLPYSECIDVMREALVSLGRGEVYQPLRTVVRPEGAGGHLALMPAYRSGPDAALGLKAVSVFRGNPAIGLDSHQGFVLVFDAHTGEARAVMNASAITEVRTASVSAVATNVLARHDASRLAIVGSGVQARAHLRALVGVRDFRDVRVASQDPARALLFAVEMGDELGVTIDACQGVPTAVADADVIVTATKSRHPVLRRDWVAPGTHINAVGSAVATNRELDSATVVAAALFADRRESLVTESGDYVLAAAESGIGPDHIRADLGEVLIGSAPGRTDDNEITLFKSLGLAVEDLAAASYLLTKAEQLGKGQWVTF